MTQPFDLEVVLLCFRLNDEDFFSNCAYVESVRMFVSAHSLTFKGTLVLNISPKHIFQQFVGVLF